MSNPYNPIPADDAGDTTPTSDPSRYYSPTALTNNALWFLEEFEGVKPLPYLDGNNLATVGIGFELTNNSYNTLTYLNEIGVQLPAEQNLFVTLTKVINGTASKSTTTSTTASLDNALSNDYFAVNQDTLPGLTAAQELTLWNEITLSTSSKSEYSTFLATLNKNNIVDVPDLLNSGEGVALFTLAYNGIFGSKSSPTLVADLANGNRADAWFQIRYGNNGKLVSGVATRMYATSEIFGLYAATDQSEADVTNAEAVSIYSDFSASTNGTADTNREWAFQYEAKFNGNIAAANSSLAGAQDKYIPAQSVDDVQVLSLEGELQWAGEEIDYNYVTNSSLNPWVGANLVADTFDPLDIQVATTQGSNTLVGSQRNSGSYVLGSGSYQNSILIAQDGDDVLDASSGGADTADAVLIGGSAGSDTILGSAGNDYIVAGTANDDISLSGGGNDTVVLGESNDVMAAGQDTVYAQSLTGDLSLYIGAGTHESVYLGSGSDSNTSINMVYANGESAVPLELTAQEVTQGIYFDKNTNQFVMASSTGSTSTLTIYSPYSAFGQSSQTQAQVRTQVHVEAAELDVDGADDTVESSSDDSSEALLDQQYASAGNIANAAMDLTLYGFSGSSEDGITLQASSSPTTPTLQASNLSSLDTILPSGGGDPYFFGDDGKNGSQLLSSIYGSNTNTASNGNFIDGFDNASFIYAGNGNNTVSAENINFDPSTDGYDNGTTASVSIEGGAGNQYLYGLSSGSETIQGGNSTVGSYQTYIFGGEAATASLSLGTEDGFIFGGTGADTLNAGADQYQNVNNTDLVDAVVFAGISDAEVGSEPIASIPAANQSAATFQIYLNGVAYLGSSLESGEPGSTTLPGSLLIGGSGNDDLVGNAGNDTLIGGTETNISPWPSKWSDTQTVLLDDVLLGGAGSNLLIAGNGTDAIFADMSPIVSNWANLDPTDSDTVYGGAGYDVVYGSGGNDYFYGGSGVFEVYVGNGESSVYAGSGSTLVVGGSGGDYIEGGSGADQLQGGSGNDTIFGGTGNSTLFGMGGSDYLNGGGGNDEIFANIDPTDNASWANAGSGDSVTIDGGGGNDTIYGSGGNNLIFANSGNDEMMLGNGATTVDAGSGNDTFYAGTGAESFLFSDNGQQDYISSQGSASSVTLDMQGTDADELTFTNDGAGDLVITDGGSTLTLMGYISSGESNVTLQFDDGSTLGASDIAYALQQPDSSIAWGSDDAPDTITANNGNETIGNLTGDNVVQGGDGYDTIYGGTGSDTIEAGSGGAAIIGGTGSETYVYNSGDGSSVINENQAAAGSDTFEFGSSLGESDISFTRQGANLVMLVDGGAEGTIEIVNYFASSSGAVHTVGSIQFSDGTSLNQAAVTAALVYNNATTNGASGNNVYSFDAFSGTNTIVQTNVSSTNAIDFTDGIVSSFIVARRDMSNDLVLTDTLDGVSVTVDNYFDNTSGNIDNNFTVNFSDGTSWNAQQILAATMTPSGGPDTLWGSDGSDSITAGAGDTLIISTTGNNTLTGGAGSDTIDGGSGADTIEGGSGTTQINGGTGAETYVYNFGDGASTITESTLSGGQDTIDFGTGITQADLSFSQVGGQELIIGVTDPSTGVQQTITIDNFFGQDPSSDHSIAQLNFADGSVLTAEGINGLIGSYSGDGNGNSYVTGTTPNASYYAGNGDYVTVQGGPGNDLLVGGNGTDTLFGGTGNNTILAGSGDDLIQGGSGNDLIELGTGNATVNVSDGNDTYDWNGTGSQVIEGYGSYYDPSTGNVVFNTKQSGSEPTNPDDNSDTKTGQDVLNIGGGVTPNELTYQLGGAGIVIGVAGTNASLSIGDISTPDSDGLYGITAIHFDDGETLSASQVLQYAVEGSSDVTDTSVTLPGGVYFSEQGSGDTILAEDGDDTIAATQGTKYIGVSGNNTILFGRGSGNDTVNGLDGGVYDLSGQLVVQLAQGVRPQDIRVVTEPDAYGDYPAYFSVQIAGTTDQLNIGAGSSGSGNPPENVVFEFADGTTWTAAQLQAYATQALNQGSTFSFGYGSGDETIPPYAYGATGQGLTVQMQAGIDPSDVAVSVNSSGDFILSLAGGADQLVGTAENLSSVQFADGTNWQLSNLETLAMLPQAGGEQYITDLTGGNNILIAEGNGDTLVGGAGNDTLDPGAGNTVMVAGSGNTTFLYNLGDGNDTIQSAGIAQNAVLELGPGIAESDVSYSTNASGTDLILTILSTGKTIDLQGFLTNPDTGGYQPSTATAIQFADGTVVSGPQVSASSLTDTVGGTWLFGDASNDTITSTAGRDVIFGGTGSESIDAGGGGDTIFESASDENGTTINGGSGNNIIYGNGDFGPTTLLFGPGSGSDTLDDVYNPTIQFASGITASDVVVQELDVTVGLATDIYTTITLAGTDDSIYLSSADSSAYLSFSNGTSEWANGTTVYSSSAPVTAATYVPWSTNNYVDNYASSGFVLTFGDDQYGSPITAANMSVVEDGANIEFIEGSTTFSLDGFYQSVLEPDGSYGYAPGNVTVQFANGTTWNSADIQQRILQDTGLLGSEFSAWLTQYGGQTFTSSQGVSQDIEQVNDGNNLIVSSGSNSSLGVTLNGWGNDTLDWDIGTDNTTTVQAFTSTDVVSFGSGALPGNLMGAVINGTNLELFDKSSGDTLIIDNYFGTGSAAGTDLGGTFEFADGLTLTDALLQALDSQSVSSGPNGYVLPGDYAPVVNESIYGTTANTSLTGTQGNDTIVAGPGNETIKGGGGDDQLYAGSGADTFVFGHGSGYDTFHGTAATGVVNTLQLTADVDPSDVAVYATGPDGTLVIELLDSGETVTLPDYLEQGASQVIQQVTFADGTVWSAATLATMATESSPNNQYIQASEVNESIAAGAGNDTLVSGGGADTLTAGTGADTLYGGAGTDLMVAGAGSASMVGGSGNETYQFAPGFGSDTILFDSASSNTIQFTDGIVASDVTATATNGQDLILNVQGGGTIVLSNALAWGGLNDLTIDYADGSSTHLSALIQSLPDYMAAGTGNESLVGSAGYDTLVADSGNDTLVAGSGNDTLVAGSGNDTLQAGAGNDLVVGGTGAFTFQVGAAAGQDTIDASAPLSGANTLQFTTDVNDIVFTRPALASTSITDGVELYMDVDDADGWTSSISLSNHYQNGASTGDIGEVAFDNGTQLSTAQVDQWLSEVSAGTSVQFVAPGNQDVQVGNDTGLVIAGSGNDTLVSGDGNESLQGGSGSDTFGFSSGFGLDTVTANWTTADDTFEFTGPIYLADVAFSVDGNNLVMTVSSSTDTDGQSSTVTLSGYFADGVPVSSTGQIVFGDGYSVSMASLNQLLAQSGGAPVHYLPSTVLTASATGDSTLTSDNGYDTFIGSSGSGLTTMIGGTGTDLMQAGSGTNEMEGGTGAETYEFAPGFGQTTIDVSADEQHANIIQFASGIDASQVTFQESYDSGALLITVTESDGSTSTISLDNHFSELSADTDDVGEIVFGDGTSVSMGQIDQLLNQSPGEPVQYSPGTGQGQSGTVLTASAGGDETLSSDGGNDTLIGGTGSTTMIGGSGNGTDLMEAGSGSNVMEGGNAIETYQFGPGFGPTTIDTSSYEFYTNTIQLTGAPSELTFSQSSDGSDLIISVTEADGSTGIITLANHFMYGEPITGDVYELTFANGSKLTMAQINQMLNQSNGAPVQYETGLSSGTSVQNLPSTVQSVSAGNASDTLTSDNGNDTLTGNSNINSSTTLIGGSGSDVMVAGSGYNVMEGGTGTETYEFGPGFGASTIEVASTEQGTNTIQFLAGIDASQLSYAEDGSNLIMTVTVSDGDISTITLANHFVNGSPVSSDIDELVFADGTTVSMAQINEQFGSSSSTSDAAVAKTMLVAESPATSSGNATSTSDALSEKYAQLASGDGVPTLIKQTDDSFDGDFAMSGKHGLAAHSFTPYGASLDESNNDAQSGDTAYSGSGVQQSNASESQQSSTLRSPGLNEGTVLASDSSNSDAGAPNDPIEGDPNDASVWASQDTADSDVSQGAGVAPRSSGTSRGQTISSTSLRNVRLGRTANAANDMIKALSAQGGVQALSGKGQGKSTASQIKLQDGTLWSLSSLDRTMAALSPTSAHSAHAAVGNTALGSADLAYTQLIEAMATFNPAASAQSSLPPAASEAYAITVAAQMH